MAEPVVSAAATQLTNLIVQEAKYLGGVDDQLKQLQMDLQMMQSFLRDTDARRAESDAVRQCVVQIKNIAYDIEDLIETFELKIASKRKGGCAKAIKRYTCIFKEATRLHEIRSQIDEIRGRIDRWTRWLQIYGMKKLMEGGSSSSTWSRPRLDRRSYPHIEEPVFGLDKNIEELVSILANDKETSSQVVAICGMAGVGKTTLAKKVYRRLSDKGCFDKFAWVYVSQQFEKEAVWEKILSCFGIKTDRSQSGLGVLLKQRDPEALASKLDKLLRENKCLVVLDDIWSTQAWDVLKPGIPTEGTNSKILLTSRNQAVAFHVDARTHLHQLECLDDDASWDLFKKTAFPRGQYSPSPDHARLEELGRKMVKHCAGLPLAIVVLGGVLAPKYGSYHEWQRVHGDVKSYIRRGMDFKVQDMLSLSYDDLPLYLKPCFLYLAHFPEDYEIDVDALVRMWVADGLVSEDVEKDRSVKMEDEAYHYWIELFERNMIRVGRQDSRMKRIATCLMHDLMRDFCVAKARAEICLHILDPSHGDVSVVGIDNIRRLAIHGVWALSIPSFTHLRSFTFIQSNAYISDWSIPKECYWLNKVISSSLVKAKEPSTFKDVALLIFYAWILIHIVRQTTTQLLNNTFKRLRVLYANKVMLAGCGVLDNIGNLIHLRYLSLAQCRLAKLPASLGMLKCLQTLDLRVDSGPFSIRIPGAIWSIKQLRHLYLPERYHCKTKTKLGNLQNLQTLVNFVVSNLHSMACLLELKNLIELRICGAIVIRDEIVRCLNSSCFSTCCCTIVEPNGKFQYLGVEEDPMPMLEKLENLKILSMEKTAFTGKKMKVSVDGFQLLEVLELHSLPNLEGLSTAEGAMPHLCVFDVQDCPNLKLLSPQLQHIQT